MADWADLLTESGENWVRGPSSRDASASKEKETFWDSLYMKQLCSELINEVSVFLSICSSHLLTFAEKKQKDGRSLPPWIILQLCKKRKTLAFCARPEFLHASNLFGGKWEVRGGRHPPTSCYISKTLNLSLENVTKYESSISPS